LASSSVSAVWPAGYNPGMDRYWKKRRHAFWCVVTLISMLAYPASFGPACWIAARVDPNSRLLSSVYWPMGRVILEESDSISNALCWYAGLGIPAGAEVSLAYEGGPEPGHIGIDRASEKPSLFLSMIGIAILAAALQSVLWWINRPDDIRPASPSD
jgi:hypothetical protein